MHTPEVQTGGPAFPQTDMIEEGSTANQGAPGMTLRDYFAAKAMPMAFDFVRRINPDGFDSQITESESMLTTYCIDWDTDEIKGDIQMVAKLSYSMADAMLEARK